MGLPVGRNLEDELMTKIKRLFDRILDTVNKENPSYTFDFEQLVDCFDENDPFTRRVFDFLVKETALRYRGSHPNARSQPRPHTIHHYAMPDNRALNSIGNNDNSTDISSNSNNSLGPVSIATHRHHYHAQRSSGSTSSSERDLTLRSTTSAAGSPITSENAPTSSSSGAALRYLLANQGFGSSSSRRARMAQRSLSQSLYTYQQGQSSLLGAMSALSNSSFTENGGSAQNRTQQDNEGTSGSSGSTSVTDVTASAIGSLRRPSRRGETLERQRAFIFRPPSRAGDLSTSMESAPDSFRIEGWNPSTSSISFTSEVYEPASGEMHGVRSMRNMQEHFAQELRQEHIRQFYIQTLQARGRQRQQQASQQSPLQEAYRRLHGEHVLPSEDSSQQSQQQQQQQQQQSYQAFQRSQTPHQPRYQLRENGLMLVQYPPSSPSSTTTSESTINRDASQSALSTSSSSLGSGLQAPLEERYLEFSDSTERGRAAMRNALATGLNIEEDHQILLTGEMSRRRRRRVIGRFSNMNGSPDIASDNSSAIISQSQQEQDLGQEGPQGQDQSSSTGSTELTNESSLEPSSSHSELHRSRQQSTEDTVTFEDHNCPAITISSPNNQPITSQPTTSIPTLMLNHIDSNAAPAITSNSTSSANTENILRSHEGLELDPTQEEDGHRHRSVPPTPPSPNPNRNPMPTFQDRRRSSINPADIEAVVREMEANAQSRARLAVQTMAPIAEPDYYQQLLMESLLMDLTMAYDMAQ
ncbi:hypothetical protein BX616_009461 [Lobosporangium transversale]|nr:hypothetical protein BX616_009461 [Lobosporangium transversale]